MQSIVEQKVIIGAQLYIFYLQNLIMSVAHGQLLVK